MPATELRCAGEQPGEDAVKHLAGVLSHRIRNALAGLIGFTDLLIGTLATPEQRDLALRILESTSHIDDIVLDLQRYSEPLRPVPRRVPVRALVEEVSAGLDEAERARLSCHVALDVPLLLYADPLLLREALLILLQNAFEAEPPDGLVRLRLEASNEQVSFEVWNAAAIDGPSDQALAPFFTTKADKLGLGLPMAYRIAAAHGGQVAVESEKERGTCVRLGLPNVTKMLSG